MRCDLRTAVVTASPDGIPRITSPDVTALITLWNDALELARSGDTLIVWKLDRLARSMKGSLPTRPPLLQPTRSYHWPGDAKRRMHRVRDRLDQRRGVGIEVERDGADHLTVLYNGVVSAPMGVVWNKLAIHWALVDGRDEV